MEKIIVTSENSNQRIDVFLGNYTDYSRSLVVKMIKEQKILVNGNKIKNSYIIKENDEISIEKYVPEDMKVDAEPMDLDIVYEDDDVIVVNKANGIVVHPAVGNFHGTLVNGLLHHAKLSNINGNFRPGIVHRIDAYTTGLLVVAKNNKAHEILAQELSEKKTHRKYVALVWGVISTDTGTIDAPIGRDKNDRKKMSVTDVNAKDAVTHFKVIERYKNATLIELELETGRTHQIRVHMNYIGYPVVNDPVYGRRKLINDSGQCLHAMELGFMHPTKEEYMEFQAPIPECFLEILNQFKDS